MKTNTSNRIRLTAVKTLAALPFLALIALSANAAEAVRYESAPDGNKCTITGSSGDSMMSHGWTMDTKIIAGFMEVDEKFPESALTDATSAKPNTSVTMPVRTFKSGKDTMNERMQIMMNSTKHPKIEYHLIELKPKSKAGATGALEFDAIGTLSIAGKTLTNSMPVIIEKKADSLYIKGSAPVKMTDYGIVPKVSLPILGDISIKDEVKIDFEWQVSKKEKAK